MPTKIEIYDCGCVTSRPKEESCRSFGTRWRLYLSLNPSGGAIKIICKCRDCGRVRHFELDKSKQNPTLIQYQEVEKDGKEEV
jgi:hypothetical protein